MISSGNSAERWANFGGFETCVIKERVFVCLGGGGGEGVKRVWGGEGKEICVCVSVCVCVWVYVYVCMYVCVCVWAALGELETCVIKKGEGKRGWGGDGKDK
jgi:hypothetical protein